MSKYEIPFNRPSFQGNELRYIEDALRSGHISGGGAYTKKCEAFLEEATGAAKALLTTSGTHALEMCALLLDLQPGDEVIVPSFAFVTTANAFASHGARPVFWDVRRDTLNGDEGLLEELITPQTKAIVALHYGGVACDMDAIMDVGERHGVAVIEDNAHGLFAAYRGKALGSFGAMAALSFHETKNVTCGEGGALLLSDPALLERAEIIREKGTDRARMSRGEVDKYTWVDYGSSYVPSDVLAAFLYAQLEAADAIQERRRAIWRRYDEELRHWGEARGVVQPAIPEGCESAHHLYYLLMPDEPARDAFIDHMKTNGILSVFHYQPLHISKMGRHYEGKPGDCPVTEEVATRLVRLPFFNDMTEAEQARVIAAVQGF